MKKFKFTIKGNIYEVEIKDFQDRTVEIEVNGTSYTVDVHHEVPQSKTPKLIRPIVVVPEGAEKIKKVVTGGHKVKSPLPGTILKILVNEGDSVEKGQTLIVMEAMKMENNVLSEKTGVVSSINISLGQNVLQGDLLIEIS